ncbi:hypothetical protein JOQ06_010862, partial [Pogonophryne albipinna]
MERAWNKEMGEGSSTQDSSSLSPVTPPTLIPCYPQPAAPGRGGQSGFRVLADARFPRDDKWHPKAQVDGEREERNSPGETDRKKRFYPGRIQWPGQKHRLVKASQRERDLQTSHGSLTARSERST